MAADKGAARKRAREAKARADAERIQREKKVEDAATDYYLAAQTVDELNDRLAEAMTERDGRVLDLIALGETVDRVAILTGLETPEIKRIRRTAKKDKPASPATGVDGTSNAQTQDVA